MSVLVLDVDVARFPAPSLDVGGMQHLVGSCRRPFEVDVWLPGAGVRFDRRGRLEIPGNHGDLALHCAAIVNRSINARSDK
jgi:hypothetical protein